MLSDPGLVIAHVEAPKVEEEPEAEVVAEGEVEAAEPEVIKKGKPESEGEGSKEGSSE